MIAATDVPHPEADEIASAQLAVDSQVEGRKLANSALHPNANTKRRIPLQHASGYRLEGAAHGRQTMLKFKDAGEKG